MKLCRIDGTTISISIRNAQLTIWCSSIWCWNVKFSIGSIQFDLWLLLLLLVMMLLLLLLPLVVWQPMSNYFASVECRCFWTVSDDFFVVCQVHSQHVGMVFISACVSLSLLLCMCPGADKKCHKFNDIMIMIMSHHWVECGWKGISKMNACVCAVCSENLAILAGAQRRIWKCV